MLMVLIVKITKMTFQVVQTDKIKKEALLKVDFDTLEEIEDILFGKILQEADKNKELIDEKDFFVFLEKKINEASIH